MGEYANTQDELSTCPLSIKLYNGVVKRKLYSLSLLLYDLLLQKS
jgi:hypothetical protein